MMPSLFPQAKHAVHASLDLMVSGQNIDGWHGGTKHIYATFGAEKLTEL